MGLPMGVMTWYKNKPGANSPISCGLCGRLMATSHVRCGQSLSSSHEGDCLIPHIRVPS